MVAVTYEGIAAREDLYDLVRGCFVIQGSTLTEWCEQTGTHSLNARAALLGIWNEAKAVALRYRLIKASKAQEILSGTFYQEPERSQPANGEGLTEHTDHQAVSGEMQKLADVLTDDEKLELFSLLLPEDTNPSEGCEAAAQQYEKADILHNERRSKIDQDPELRAFVLNATGYGSIESVRKACLQRFGKERVPGRTAFYNYATRVRESAHQETIYNGQPEYLGEFNPH